MSMTFHVEAAEPTGQFQGQPVYGPEPGAPECNLCNSNAALFLRAMGHYDIVEEYCGTIKHEETHAWLRYLMSLLNTDNLATAGVSTEVFHRGQVTQLPVNMTANTIRVKALMDVFSYAAQHGLQVYVG